MDYRSPVRREQLATVAKRYRETSRARKHTEDLVEGDRALEADTAERVMKRAERVGVEPIVTRALLNHTDPAEFARTFLNRTDPAAINLASARLRRGKEAILGTPDFQGVYFLEKGAQVLRTVGIIGVAERGASYAVGTGFMVSPRLLMTNNHVIGTTSEAARSWVRFNYQLDALGGESETFQFGFDPEDFFLTDPELDYTLVAVTPQSVTGWDLATVGWNRLVEEQGKVINAGRVNIIQHPGGEPKQVVVRNNSVLHLDDPFLYYECDTLGGSSGSPVYSDQWLVVALHHHNVPKTDAQGRYLSADDQVLPDDTPEDELCYVANEGTRISRILAHVKRRSLKDAQKALRKEMLEKDSPLDGLVLPVAMNPGAEATRTPATMTNPSSPREGGAVTGLPLEITIRIDSPSVRPNEKVLGEEDEDLEVALRALAESRTRPYYDREDDELKRRNYYEGFSISGDKEENYQNLHALLEGTHLERPSYDTSRKAYLYPWVDLHPDRQLYSIYSGRTYDPERLIREDFRIEQERTLRLQRFLRSEATRNPERLQAEAQRIEEELKFNCEHVVPQSWFGRKEPMRGDLHHLFTCEDRCNSFRGNYPYFDFPGYGPMERERERLQEVDRPNCGRLEDDSFEPFGGRGAVARATLYFLLRYPGEIGDAERELQREALATLIKWHKAEEPTAYELHRNLAIYNVQGNRNPLIDYPEWAEEIRFSQGLA